MAVRLVQMLKLSQMSVDAQKGSWLDIKTFRFLEHRQASKKAFGPSQTFKYLSPGTRPRGVPVGAMGLSSQTFKYLTRVAHEWISKTTPSETSKY